MSFNDAVTKTKIEIWD